MIGYTVSPLWEYTTRRNSAVLIVKERSPHAQEMDANVCFLAPPHASGDRIQMANWSLPTIGLDGVA